LDIIPKIEGKQYTLELPVEAIGVFVSNEEAIYAYAKEQFEKREKPLPQFFDNDTKVTYRVRSGDYLGKIARQYGVGISQIKQWNGLRNNNLRIGQRLTIYPRGTVTPPKTTASSSQTPASKTSTAGKSTYTVKQGDSLWSISQKFPGVSVDNLKKWNNLSGNNLKVGMILAVSE
jgi:membrane-bound lytic murein transglycosylase D